MHAFLSLLLIIQILFFSAFAPAVSMPPAAQNNPPNEALAASISAPAAVLMEASTGTVIFEKDSHSARHPASITKIMTLILIFDALKRGTIRLSDPVSVSEHAAGMGGSQVFLEPGETQTVETMIKCISIASANDASVAMAEFISGSEEAFVAEMNAKAKSLGMNDTSFVNCCGLDADGHMTSAYDVALMSRELSVNYPEIHSYCTVWMDTITHATARGTSEFGLTNTNKLIRQYEYATGLKTGSTSLAKFCVSATAQKDGMEMIAIIMGAENPKQRFADAVALLNYGFSKCQIYTDAHPKPLERLAVRRGTSDSVALEFKNPFQYLSVTGADFSQITKEIALPDYVTAPAEKGSKIGEAIYRIGAETLGSVDIIAAEDVKKAGFPDYLKEIFLRYFA